ncbi:hypothetical protein BC826DRAFT_976737 [Russula brevipes]|nr:hypothetical protein BC826DRAFT_976737 [Russula brevipes]
MSQFLKIKKHVEYLAKMLGDKNRRSIVQEMRDAAIEANKLITYVDEHQEGKEQNTCENFSQTSPLLSRVTGKDPKRKQTTPANENATYADILRQVKSDPNLKEVGKAVAKIRRTQKGDLLFQLVESGGKSAQVSEKLKEVLGEQAEVKALCQRSEIEIKDVDEVTQKKKSSKKSKNNLILMYRYGRIPA